MEYLTKQEIFDTVARHLLAQRRPSSDAPNSCLYRGPNGMKCAAGVLIKDEYFLPEFNNYSVSRIYDNVEFNVMFQKSGINVDNDEVYALVSHLQYIHDDTNRSFVLNMMTEDSVAVRWKGALQVAAERFGLNVDVLKEF